MLPLLPCFKVLPLVYDESLSYYEVLCKLTKLLQEMAKMWMEILIPFKMKLKNLQPDYRFKGIC